MGWVVAGAIGVGVSLIGVVGGGYCLYKIAQTKRKNAEIRNKNAQINKTDKAINEFNEQFESTKQDYNALDKLVGDLYCDLISRQETSADDECNPESEFFLDVLDGSFEECIEKCKKLKEIISKTQNEI